MPNLFRAMTTNQGTKYSQESAVPYSKAALIMPATTPLANIVVATDRILFVKLRMD
jgi:hypothetical protein